MKSGAIYPVGKKLKFDVTIGLISKYWLGLDAPKDKWITR